MKYRYFELGEHGEEITVDITEEQILAKYGDYWCEQVKKVGNDHMISKENCIMDFCSVHWASPIEEE